MVGGLWGMFEGETIYIISEKPIPEISYSMGKGTSIAANIDLIDQFLIQNGMSMLSSFCETTNFCISIKNSILLLAYISISS